MLLFLLTITCTWLQDKDLAPLRERREWRDAVEAMTGALSSKNLVAVRAEQRSPFRLFRLILTGGLGAGALLGLLLIAARLLGALKGSFRLFLQLSLPLQSPARMTDNAYNHVCQFFPLSVPSKFLVSCFTLLTLAIREQPLIRMRL